MSRKTLGRQGVGQWLKEVGIVFLRPFLPTARIEFSAKTVTIFSNSRLSREASYAENCVDWKREGSIVMFQKNRISFILCVYGDHDGKRPRDGSLYCSERKDVG